MSASTFGERTNAEWLNALGQDEDGAWTDLRARVRRGLLAYANGGAASDFSSDERTGLVEEATQEALLTVRSKLQTFRDESRFTTWVYRIAVNALLGDLRRRRWERRMMRAFAESGPESEASLETSTPDPERAALQSELWRLVRDLIDRELTDYQRTVLVDHGIRQKPLDLVAQELGVTRDAVYKAIHDARRKLRAALLERGVGMAETLAVFR